MVPHKYELGEEVFISIPGEWVPGLEGWTELSTYGFVTDIDYFADGRVLYGVHMGKVAVWATRVLRTPNVYSGKFSPIPERTLRPGNDPVKGLAVKGRLVLES